MLVASAALTQERYSVTLQLDADDDPEFVTRQLAATYRLQIEPAQGGSSRVIVRADDSAIRILRNERRVVAVEAVRPPSVAANASGFGAYTYDGAGNITQVGSDSFIYDTRGRVEKATIRGIAQTFTYDRWGNITNIATTGESDHAIGVGTGNRLPGATYDDSGNLLRYHGGTFVYDGLNVVRESTPTGGNRHLYLYTAANERIATIQILPTGQRQAEWTIRDDTGKVLRRFHQNLSGAWSWTEDYIYRGSQLLAGEVPSPEKVRHFHLDHLGTPRLITGNGGAFIAERTYGAFGRGLDVDSTPAPDELAQFTGHERDSFQLDSMHARYYDPMIGRFLSVDPVLDIKDALHEPQLWNRYSYVTNNPLKFTDPDGRYRTFYKEKPMTAENLTMDENTPAVVEYSVYATGGLTALGSGGLFFTGGGGGGLAAGAFRLHPIARGNFIETAFATAFGGALPRTFPVIDRFLNGVATSVKSLDLMSKTYQNTARLTSTLTGFIDKLAQFNGARLGNVVVRGEDITQRVLEIVVQRGAATPQQLEALRRAQAYAQANDIRLKVIMVK